MYMFWRGRRYWEVDRWIRGEDRGRWIAMQGSGDCSVPGGVGADRNKWAAKEEEEKRRGVEKGSLPHN